MIIQPMMISDVMDSFLSVVFRTSLNQLVIIFIMHNEIFSFSPKVLVGSSVVDAYFIEHFTGEGYDQCLVLEMADGCRFAIDGCYNEYLHRNELSIEYCHENPVGVKVSDDRFNRGK